MLASAEVASVVAEAIRKHNVSSTVIDPVMVSTSGAQLLPENAVQILLKDLLPITTILTPNLPEAKLLLKEAGTPFASPKSTNDLTQMAKV
jgi:hydroxymethylpyrimidine/phosphomethylpyrimidine kinase